jgi:hypothetical protein
MAKAAQQTSKGKPAPAKPAPQSRAVATKTANSGAVAAAADEELLKMMAQDAGKGVSTAVEDNIVPLIYILQALSPQVQKKKEEYIDGAEAGMIWFRGTKDVVAGEEGIPVVPCHFSKCWIEWQPNRGGFVARHEDKPDDAVLTTDAENPKRKFWKRPNGNIVVETREHVVLVLDIFDRPMPFVIPMSGSGHGASRAWMSNMNRKVIPNTDIKAPSYAFIYRMKLQFLTNADGDWYMWDVHDENDEPTMLSDPATYRLARQIEADFAKGKLKADAMTDDQVDSRPGGEGENAKGQRAAEHI